MTVIASGNEREVSFVTTALFAAAGAEHVPSRLVNEAEGYRNQKIPGARAEAIELTEKAKHLRPVLEQMGEFSARFCATDVFRDKRPRAFKQVLAMQQ